MTRPEPPGCPTPGACSCPAIDAPVHSREWFIQKSREAQAKMKELAKVFPGCFDEDGRAIVASASLPAAPTATAPSADDERKALPALPTPAMHGFHFGDQSAKEAYTADQMHTYAAEAVRDALARQEPVLWWNGILRADERDRVQPSVSPTEDTWHDIPLYYGVNQCNLAAPAAAAPAEAPAPAQAEQIMSLVKLLAQEAPAYDEEGCCLNPDAADLLERITAAMKGTTE